MSRLEVEPGRHLYFEHHPGRRPAVVLVHGWGMSCRAWDGVLVPLLEAGHAVVAFDQRACGRSDGDFTEVSVAASAGDVVALLDALGIERAVLNGWSLGAAIAVAAAHRLGGRCLGVVATAGATPRYVRAPDFPYGGEPGSVGATVAALRADRAGFLHALAQAVFAQPPSPPVLAWVWGAFMQATPAADRALLELDSLDQRDLLRRLPVPFLSMVGARDAVAAPEIGRIAAELAPQGRLAEFADSGHAPFLEEAPRYHAVLRDFLQPLT
jgi:pimeloyl-[acyl-carrier protein] methyl ester esterase